MELLKLLVEFVGHIIWPLTVVVIAVAFRKPIIAKLVGLRKVTHGKTFLEFAAEHMPKEESIGKLKLSEITKETYNWDNYLDTLEEYAWAVAFSEMLIRMIPGYPPHGKKDSGIHQFLRRKCDSILAKIEKERPESKLPGIARIMAIAENLSFRPDEESIYWRGPDPK
jgi:hypothetical protein